MSYNTAIIACGEGGSWELALELFREIAPAASASAPASVPASASASAAPPAGAAGEGGGAGAPRRKIPVTADLISYNTIIDVCKKCGRWQEAVDIFREMSRTPGGPAVPNVVTYTSAFVACGRGGRWDQALEVFMRAAALT